MGLSTRLSLTFFFISTVFSLPLTHRQAAASPLLYDGRAPLNLDAKVFDDLSGAYTFVVKGTKDATDYISLRKDITPTPLFTGFGGVSEQTIAVGIDNTSIFAAGGNPQLGFRRTEAIAQPRDRNIIETGTTVFHFSMMRDSTRDLNFAHEYQPVFIEPDDGSHVFGLQVGTPFSIPTGNKAEETIRVQQHNGNVLFETPFEKDVWHNFAVQVNWDALTLGVFFSKDNAPLKAVTPKAVANTGQAAVKGDFHFGLLKLPLADPKDGNGASDVAHRGIQEGTVEGLFYSGVFVEGISGGISAGLGQTISPV